MTETTNTPRSLPLLEDQTTDSGGCGCGECGCGAEGADSAATPATTSSAAGQNAQTTRSYAVSGMTCGHCAAAVTSELKALDGVTDVNVELVAGGTSTVTVTSSEPLDTAHVVAALDEAGDYQLA